ncbi:hypothetical protein K435DRAFT_857809 [Dendrothele bispora CBS 962.96]|uniref:DRBM domain-containing protein n=1 Tax=Dendrothele bispora (strain CBS 962.96) TaxID=1314807 RepID=A0A4S8KZ63_DENBC|nr:hypothetical protein K435DRAFT_873871 [Dendrothele bispora CBS 962.96]THU97185.1 hypothetical protein K435DRAFT_857809 [Dendrothele bispora CBS 962.96]
MDLNNWGQRTHKKIEYEYHRSGPQHNETWTVIVRVDEQEYGRGVARNRRGAEEAAAGEALRVIQQL